MVDKFRTPAQKGTISMEDKIQLKMPDGTIRAFLWCDGALLDLQDLYDSREFAWMDIMKWASRPVRSPFTYLKSEPVPTA